MEQGPQKENFQPTPEKAEEEILDIIEFLKDKVTDHSVIPSLQRLIMRLRAKEVSPQDALAIARSVKSLSTPLTP